MSYISTDRGWTYQTATMLPNTFWIRMFEFKIFCAPKISREKYPSFMNKKVETCSIRKLNEKSDSIWPHYDLIIIVIITLQGQ